jgi:uncharacterized membrane protein YjgN (DUF898 family)
MSDEMETTAPTPATAPVAPAAQAAMALTVQELGDGVARLRKQIKALWAAVIVVAVVVVAVAAFTLAPRLLGVRTGGFQGRPGGFNPNQSQQTPQAPQQ